MTETKGCHCGVQPHCAYDTTVIFFREDRFYPITGAACEDWYRHAELNPETHRIERLDGTRIWPEGSQQ